MILPRDLEVGEKTIQYHRKVIEARHQEKRKGRRPRYNGGDGSEAEATPGTAVSAEKRTEGEGTRG